MAVMEASVVAAVVVVDVVIGAVVEVSTEERRR